MCNTNILRDEVRFMNQEKARKYAKELEDLFTVGLRAFQGQDHAKLDGLGITFPQLILLRILSNEPNQPMRSLAGKLGLGLPATTGIVGRLVKAGLVRRHRDRRDRRVVRVSITSKGSGVLARAVKVRQKEAMAILLKMEENEGKEFLRLLTKFLRLAVAEVEKRGV